jgi:uracil-DNA glycosylase
MTREELREALSFYRDLGVTDLYRQKPPAGARGSESALPSRGAEAALPTGGSEPALLSRDRQGAVSGAESLIPLAPSGDTLEQIQREIGPDCRRCRLCEQRSKIVFGVGSPQARLVFVGEGPGADEDAQGIPFVGRAGQLLTQMIDNTAAREGIPIRRADVYICNVVKCRPPENRTPLPDEMEICGEFLFRQLMAIRPKAIVALGSTAAKALLGTKDGVTRLRGSWHKWRDIPLIVTYHPSYLLRPYNQNAKREAWEDLKKALHFVYD